jgi:hypothetical protein
MTALSDLVAGPDEVLFSRERLRPARPEAPLRRYGGPWHSPSAEPWSSGRTMVFDPGCMMTSGIETVLKPGKRHLAIVRTRHNRAGIPLSVGPVSSLDHRCASALRDKSQSMRTDPVLQMTQRPRIALGPFLSIRRWRSHTEPQVGTPQAFPRSGSQAIAVP